MEIQPSWRSTFWRNRGTSGAELRKAMIAVLDGRSLTDDVLITTMCLLEQTLNGRPLTSVRVDPDDLEPLTRNHFLL